jgi:hypothetical protein
MNQFHFDENIFAVNYFHGKISTFAGKLRRAVLYTKFSMINFY